MTFYHGTTSENWKKIQEEGVLFGVREVVGSTVYHPSRCTYLTPDINEAKCYGDVVLQVEFDPYKNKEHNNYIDDCWQFRVYEPIDIKDIKQII